MAITVGQNATKLIDSSDEPHLYTVRNTGGTNPTFLSRSAGVTATGTTAGYQLAINTAVQVWLAEGEQLFGICASGLTTTVDAV